jgi:hypothetical protein
MTDLRRFGRICVVVAAFGLLSPFGMVEKPSFGAIRTADVVQLIGVGVCFGAAIMALAVFLRSSRTNRIA